MLQFKNVRQTFFILIVSLGLIGYHDYKKSTREVIPPPAPVIVAQRRPSPIPQPVPAPVAKVEEKPTETVVSEQPVTKAVTPEAAPAPAPPPKPYFPEIDTIPVQERKTIFDNIVYHYN